MSRTIINNEDELLKLFKSAKNSKVLFENSMWERGWLEIFVEEVEFNKKIFYKCLKEKGKPCNTCLNIPNAKFQGAKMFRSNKIQEFNKYVKTHCDDLESDEDKSKESEEEKDKSEEDEDKSEEEVVRKKSKKRKKYQKFDTRIISVIEDFINPLQLRVSALEKELKRKNLAEAARAYDVKSGVCTLCMKKTKTNSVGKKLPLKPSLIQLSIFKEANARNMSASSFKDLFVNKNRYCSDCKNECQKKYKGRWFCVANAKTACVICRSNRRTQGTLHCSTCKVTLLQSDHATYKGPMHYAFKVLEETLDCVKEITTSFDTNPVDGELRVGEDSVDFVIEITTKDNVKHMYFIEIMNTKTEQVIKYSKKFQLAIEKLKPTKSYMIAFDIKNEIKSYNLTLKIDILRRWVVFTLLYSQYIPRITNWWFFCDYRNAYPLRNLANLNEFLKNPIKISKPPKNIKSDWEFATDVYADFNVYEDFEDIGNLMFNGSFEENKAIWSLYNSDKSNHPVHFSAS